MFKPKGLLFVVALLCVLFVTPFHQASAQESKAPLGQVQAQPSDEVVWQRFLAWMPSATAAGGALPVINEYLAQLTSAGTPAAEIDRQRSVISRMMKERPEGQRILYNKTYTSSSPQFTTQPNALLVSTVEGRKPGRALDVGMGQGRNALFLAMKGWDVTGFDISDEGIAVARKNAERAGVKVNAVQQTVEAFDYGIDQWDLIVFVYEPFPVTSAAYVERLRKSLKTGGLFVFETHAAEPGKPRPTIAVDDPLQVLAAFKDFRLLYFQDTVTRPDWPAREGEESRIVRMVVEKRP